MRPEKSKSLTVCFQSFESRNYRFICRAVDAFTERALLVSYPFFQAATFQNPFSQSVFSTLVETYL